MSEYQLQHNETDALGIEYRLAIAPDDSHVVGNAIASGDAEVDRQTEADILCRLEAGDQWAWCTVRCQAWFNSFHGSDYLGACSYKDAADFIQPNGYWKDMKAQAKDNLLKMLSHAAEAHTALREAEHPLPECPEQQIPLIKRRLDAIRRQAEATDA